MKFETNEIPTRILMGPQNISCSISDSDKSLEFEVIRIVNPEI